MLLCHVMNIFKFLVDIIILRRSIYLLRNDFFVLIKNGKASNQSKHQDDGYLQLNVTELMYDIGEKSDRDNSTTLKTLEKYDFVKINRN